MGLPAALVIFVGFLSLGASFILQLLVALGLPYIKGIYFLYTDFSNGSSTLRLTFGIWAQCLASDGVKSCTSTGLGYQQAAYSNVIAPFFVNKLPYALVVQPVAAGFTGLAAGAAFLHLCTNTILWPLAAIWASFLTMAALVIELVLFILARNKYRSFDGVQGTGSIPIKSELGPAIWMQVAALPPCFFGFMMLAAGWWLKRSRYNSHYQDDYEPARPSYVQDKDDYYYQPAPPPARVPSRQSRRSRYAPDDYYEDDERVYGNVGRRDSRRESGRSMDRRSGGGYGYDRDRRISYEDRPARRSYAGDAYGSRTSLAPPAGAPYRGGRSRRYSERGAY
ncbi:uncharacterized protein PFL1_00182 [Pseudozyma flocculosa PF-1]|uniref:Uncharacterized protein n=1 Tax=Pseudozyma flocculosa TaxID=84751 RepID=A0A5C3ERZ5_9BASI|nr:uncharacterized protein PFL1_00182 [Pseudozyma flocculosa PF-1]EPQ31984.1 hypothetical protein PFL1_00182 [Pseudozyma flocculosa PF-1]SPO35093.1 uncharacterized protein PSFLO_00564 [Pseudozyma flocculosa]